MKKSITTPAALLLPAMTATRAARIAAAVTRHPNATPDNIMLPTIGDYIITAAARDLRSVSRARYSSSAQPLMLQLYRDAQQYLRATYAADTITAADEQRDEAAALREDATSNTRTADRISTPAAQAEALRDEADSMRSDAAELVQTALDTERHAPGLQPFGDGADIAQDAALQRWIDYTTNGAQDMRKARSAAGRGIAAVKAAAGIPAARTKVESFDNLAAADLKRAGELPREAGSKEHPYTDEQREAISAHADSMREAMTQRYAGAEKMPFSVREGMTAGYYTIEYRNSDRFPAAWYRVSHYATFAPARLDDYATGAAEDSDSRATLADTVREMRAHLIPGAEVEPCDIIEAAKLSDRERRILTRAVDQSDPIIAAVDLRAGERFRTDTDTHADTLSKSSAKRYRARRAAQEIQYRSAATLRAAAQLEGVPAAQLPNMRSRIKAKLTAARDDLKAARLNRSGAPQIDPAPRLVWWYEAQGPQTADPAPAIRWTRRPHAVDVQTISTAQLEQEEQQRQERIRNHAGDIAYLDMYRSTRDAARYTADGWHSATRAAWAFVAVMDEDSRRAWWTAEHARREDERQRNERRRAAAKASGIYSLNSTFEQWQRWTAAERAEHVRFLRSLSE